MARYSERQIESISAGRSRKAGGSGEDVQHSEWHSPLLPSLLADPFLSMSAAASGQSTTGGGHQNIGAQNVPWYVSNWLLDRFKIIAGSGIG